MSGEIHIRDFTPLGAVKALRRRHCTVCGSNKMDYCKAAGDRCEYGILFRYVEEREKDNGNRQTDVRP